MSINQTSRGWLTLAPDDKSCRITVTWPSWDAKNKAVAPSWNREDVYDENVFREYDLSYMK